MPIFISLLFFLLAPVLNSDESNTKLKMIQPNWRFEVKQRYSDGTPKILLFYAQSPVENREVPIKQINYFADNTIANEVDLNENSLPHGPRICYDRQGLITQIIFYKEGKKEGQAKVFYPSGVLKSLITYHIDQLDGPAETYYDNGRLKENFTYQTNKINGDFHSYYESGMRLSQAKYEQGFLTGLYREWYEKGSPKTELYYFKGFLNNEGAHTAIKRYFEDHTVQEVQNFLLGMPHGEHLQFNDKGALIYKAKYKKGFLDEVPEGTLQEIHVESHSYPALSVFEIDFTPNLEASSPIEVNMSDGEHKEYYDLQEDQTEPQLAKINNYKNGKLQGEQKAYYPNGELKVISNYVDGLLNGPKKYWNALGELILEANYDQGLLNGRHFILHPDGSEQISHYKNNQLHGMHEIYYQDDTFFGRVKALEVQYENGKMEGELIKYNPAGTKTMCSTYHQGKKEGVTHFYTDGGHLILSAEYKEDLQNGMTCKYYTNGKVRKESLFLNGEKVGEEKTYHENGKLSSLRHYEKGNLNGLCQEWNAEGVLIFEAEYLNGKRNGKFNKYDDKGLPIVLQIFKNDKLIEKKK